MFVLKYNSENGQASLCEARDDFHFLHDVYIFLS